MFCTVCEIVTADLSHYKTSLHTINARRKLIGHPPLTIDELDSESATDDLSLNLDFDNSSSTTQVSICPFDDDNIERCMFCGERETSTHHRHHGLSDEQAYYLRNNRCYVCYEKFCNSCMLIKHIDGGRHRTAVTNGVSLYLGNGKILNPERMLMSERVTARSGTFPRTRRKAEKIVERVGEARKHSRLMASMAKNRTWEGFLH